MTRHMVEITFSNAIRQASRLDECADEMTDLARNSMSNISGDIAFAWQGHSASAYLGKMEITADNIQATADRLRNIAHTIRFAANRFRDAELRAIELAERRDH